MAKKVLTKDEMRVERSIESIYRKIQISMERHKYLYENRERLHAERCKKLGLIEFVI